MKATIQNSAHAVRSNAILSTLPIPSKVRASIKFGYEETMGKSLNGQNFDSWIAKVMCHTQEHFFHESYGTEIHFDVGLMI